jgi:hypothetical protein
MARILLPQIAEENYEAVRSALKHGVPATYHEWLDLRSKWLKSYAEDNVVFIEVDPKEFARYFDTAGRAHDLRTLFEFVWSKDSK